MKDECSKLAPLISRYIDGECPPNEMAIIEEHLASCSACRKLKEEFEAVTSLAASTIPQEEPGDVNWDAMWSNIEKQAFPSRPALWEKIGELFKRPMIWFPAAALSAAAAALFFLNIYPQARQQVTKTVPVCRVESVSSRSGQVMIFRTAKTGQPLIWIMPTTTKDAHS